MSGEDASVVMHQTAMIAHGSFKDSQTFKSSIKSSTRQFANVLEAQKLCLCSDSQKFCVSEIAS